jgi:hypothetical protein
MDQGEAHIPAEVRELHEPEVEVLNLGKPGEIDCSLDDFVDFAFVIDSGPPRFFTRVCDVIQTYREVGVKEPVCQGGGKRPTNQAPRSCPHVFPVSRKWKFICGCFGNLATIDPHNVREAT